VATTTILGVLLVSVASVVVWAFLPHLGLPVGDGANILGELGWAVTLSALLPGSNALYLIFGEGPRDDMTTASSRLTLAVWAVTALLAGGWRLLRTDARR
jgi:hypothetical protein